MLPATIAWGAGFHRAAAQAPSAGVAVGGDMRTTDTPVVVGGPVEVLLGVVVLGLFTALITALISKALDARRPGGDS